MLFTLTAEGWLLLATSIPCVGPGPCGERSRTIRPARSFPVCFFTKKKARAASSAEANKPGPRHPTRGW